MSSHFLLLFLILLLLLLFVLFETCIGFVDPKFEACEPKTCGNNQSITFPFYIKGKQEPFCGYPRYELTCSNNGFPILTSRNGTQYMVNEIFYDNQSIRVSVLAFSQPNTTLCIPLIHSFFNHSKRFSVAPKQKEVLLFYGCDSDSLSSLPEEIMTEHRIGCYAENKTTLVMAFYREDPSLSIAGKSCKGRVENTIVEDEKGGVREALRKGFVLNWNASHCSSCTRSGGRCGFDLDPQTYAFRCYCPDGPHSADCAPESEKTGHKYLVIIATTVSTSLGIGVLIFLIYCFTRRSWSHKLDGLWKDKSKAHQDFEAFLRNHGPLAIRRYNYLEIKKMTNSFKEKLGQGGYGGVFKGKILDERQVAVKMLNRSKGDGEEFISEVASISRTSHVNIVTLLGFCFEGSKRALVYEYMANGSLEKFIYGTNPMTLDNQLNCETLCQIAIGVARGLEYLHKGCNTRIFHFDIKPHNILLDENFCPKISDFGLAKICPTNESMVSMLGARGTPGYIAPEVLSRNFGPISHKSDVYSFGMMVLEMVGGRKNINVEVDCTSEIYFPHWIYKRLELGEEFALKNITNESDKEKVRKMVIVSLWCIQTDPSDRPTMRAVVDMLEGKVETLQIPPKPFLSSPSRSSSHSSIN